VIVSCGGQGPPTVNGIGLTLNGSRVVNPVLTNDGNRQVRFLDPTLDLFVNRGLKISGPGHGLFGEGIFGAEVFQYLVGVLVLKPPVRINNGVTPERAFNGFLTGDGGRGRGGPASGGGGLGHSKRA